MSARRADFPLIVQRFEKDQLCYLDSAATAQKPSCVIEALHRFYSNNYATVHRGIYRLAQEATEQFERCREKLAQFLGARSVDEVVITRGTTDSLNLLAQALRRSGRIKRGDELILNPLEHHANLLPWQMLAADTGARLVSMRADALGRIDLDHFKSICCARTRIIALSHMSNVTGGLYPAGEIVEIARAQSPAWIVVDGAQSAPHLAIDVQALDCDFFCFSGHKLYGPTGVGALWGRLEHLQQLPPAAGGGHIVEQVQWNASTFGPPPGRFEPGTPPIAEAVGLSAAIEYLESFAAGAIFEHEAALTKRCCRALAQMPRVRIIGQPEGPIVSFVVDGVHALDLATWLDVEGICIRSGHHCAQPAMTHFDVPATARISFALYNTTAEVDRAVEAIARCIDELT